MKRRTYLRRIGAGVAGTALVAGCSGTNDGAGDAGGATTGTSTGTPGEPSGTLTVATYSSFTGEGTAGSWLKSAFESAYADTTVEFTTPENGINGFVQRKRQGAPVDADVYVGLNVGELVRIDETLSEPLFVPVEEQLSRADAVQDSLRIDPDGRAIPYDTGFIALVYDEGEVSEPETFDALLSPEYENGLIAQNAQTSDPGRAFLLWTINEYGPDGYLDYWAALADNGVRILSDWEPAYNAYTSEEAPMVVSYSTDQVYYHGDGVDTSRHQVAFLGGQGYANPEAMATFADSDNQRLARAFMDFVLTDEAQAEIATRNVQFPAVAGVDPGGDFGEYALRPPEPVTFRYDELAGNVGTWIDQWARQIAGG
jgi:thiamine transport system substrate-binding protein